jgi:hypothetical protein
MTPNLHRAMVYEHLVRRCLNLYVDTARDIKRHWGLEMEEIARLELRSPPNFVTNLIASNDCAERFDLVGVEGFYQCRGLWWLDIDVRLATRGLIVPTRDRKRPTFIVGLQIYRHVRDSRPFMLRVRQERITA